MPADAPDVPAPSASPAHRPPVRLRDLAPAARVVAAVAALLLLVPVGASVGRAVADGWVPSNDEALIVLRARDVLGPDPPLVGQPSTAGQYASDHPARHPGPIEFYLLAGPVRLLGPTWGTLLTVAAVTAASVLLTAWVALRRAGPAVGLGAVVLVALVLWSSGTALLTDPISSNAGALPLVAGTALAWALWLDDRRLWPLAAVVWSYTAQQHLAILGPAGVVAAWGVLGAVVATARRGREPGRLRSSAAWAAAAVGVALVCWLPPLIDQAVGTGNLRYILGFGGSEERATLGVDDGLRAVGRVLGWPPFLLRRDVDGGALIAPYDTVTTVGALVGLAVLVGLAALAGGRLLARRGTAGGDGAREGPGPDVGAAAVGPPAPLGPRLVLALTGLLLAAIGVVTTANVPDSFEQIRVNFYRWAWPTAVAATGSLAWAVLPALARRARVVVARPVGGPAVAALVVVALLAGATAAGDGDMDQRRDDRIHAFEVEAAAGVLAAVDHHRPVHLVTRGSAAFLALTPALAVALEDAGLDVRIDVTDEAMIDEAQEGTFGAHRLVAAGAADDVGARVHVVTGPGPLPEVAGEVVATFATGVRMDRLVAEAAAEMGGADLTPSAGAEAILRGHRDDIEAIARYLVGAAPDDPEAVLRTTLFLDLLQAGYYAEPPVAPALVAAMEAELHRGVEVWGDDRFAVVVERLPGG